MRKAQKTMEPYEVTGFVEHSHKVSVDASTVESAVRQAVDLINRTGARVHSGNIRTEKGQTPFHVYYSGDGETFDIDIIGFGQDWS